MSALLIQNARTSIIINRPDGEVERFWRVLPLFWLLASGRCESPVAPHHMYIDRVQSPASPERERRDVPALASVFHEVPQVCTGNRGRERDRGVSRGNQNPRRGPRGIL